MWEKIKAFFENKVTIIVESIIIAICAVGLYIGGVNAEEAMKTIALDVGAILAAIVALIRLIEGLTKK